MLASWLTFLWHRRSCCCHCLWFSILTARWSLQVRKVASYVAMCKRTVATFNKGYDFGRWRCRCFSCLYFSASPLSPHNFHWLATTNVVVVIVIFGDSYFLWGSCKYRRNDFHVSGSRIMVVTLNDGCDYEFVWFCIRALKHFSKFYFNTRHI